MPVVKMWTVLSRYVINNVVLKVETDYELNIVPCFMLGGIPVPTAWRVLGLRMEERPPDMEVSCEYIE
jgi:hypothetical protein